MNEHKGTAFFNSCVKVPVDPYSRQPTPSYDRPDLKNEKSEFTGSIDSSSSSPRDPIESCLDLLSSIPDYRQVHHLSNEQFRQKLEYLKRKQRLFLKSLENPSLDWKEEAFGKKGISRGVKKKSTNNEGSVNGLELRGKKCYFEQSRGCSPLLYRPGSITPLIEDEDLLTYRFKDGGDEKERKTMRNNEIHSASKSSNAWNELNIAEGEDSESESNETKSLPAPSTRKEWHPTVPKPFSFTLREEAEKYMTRVEKEAEEREPSGPKGKDKGKKRFSRKRVVRPIPITSKIPLYDQLLAEKEERSRMVREESALSLLSQVRPFKLECERRAGRFLARSNPELGARRNKDSTSKSFRAKPVPSSLFGTEVYDRMLEDEYYRHLRKKVRASELMKSSTLPPSMARRERLKSSLDDFQSNAEDNWKEPDDSNDIFYDTIAGSSRLSSHPSNVSLLATRGTNLAAILRCQASREKLERELREEMEERRREQALRTRESLIGRKPVWRALRSAARHEHERDLHMRTSLRRDEAREQSERHRLQMEMMLDRVTQIPTLFERHSQSYQTLGKLQQKKLCPRATRRKTRSGSRNLNTASIDSYFSFPCNSAGDSGSLAGSSDTVHSLCRSSSKSSGSFNRTLGKSVLKSETLLPKKKGGERGQLKVSINETAQLIEDRHTNDFCDSQSSPGNHDDCSK